MAKSDTTDKKVPTPKETRNKWRMWLRVLGIALGILLLVRLGWGVLSARDARRAVAEAEAAGWPMTMAEVLPPPVGPADDAWPLYQELLAQADQAAVGVTAELQDKRAAGRLSPAEAARFQAHQTDQELLRQWFDAEQRTPELAEALGRRLEALEPLLERLEQASARPAVAWPRDGGPVMPTPDLSLLTPLVHFQMARALHRFDAGEHAAALADLATAVGVANHLAELPTLEGRAAEASLIGFASGVLQRMLPGLETSPQARQMLRAALAGGSRREQFLRAVRFSHARLHETYRALADGQLTLEGQPIDGGLGQGLKIWLLRPFLDNNLAHALRTYREVMPLLERPFAEGGGEVNAFAEAFVEEAGGMGQQMRLWASVSVYNLLNAAGGMATSRAQREMMSVALALRAWQRDHDGALPAELGALVGDYLPALPVDPFTGEPIGYLPDDEYPRLYTAGMDRTDDGGTCDPADPVGHRGHDVCFFLQGTPPPTTQPTTQPAATQPAIAPATQPATAPAS